jgi:COP9 signalosome complex subunit 7
MSADLADGSSLQPFCLLAKSAKGKGCVAIIEQALQAPGVFVFGELLDMPNIKQVSGSSHL